MKKPGAPLRHGVGTAMLFEARWGMAIGGRGVVGPARCWIMEPGPARADELCRSLPVGADGTPVGIVALDFIEADGATKLDGAYLAPCAARQMYDEITARARALPKGAPRVLAVDRARMAGFGLSNVVRALMLEEPGHFDVIILADSGDGPTIERLKILCQRLGAGLDDSAG